MSNKKEINNATQLSTIVPKMFTFEEGKRYVSSKKYVELSALKGLLRERKITYGRMAGEIGLSTRAFTHRINGRPPFDVVEAKIISEYFKFTPGEVNRYFFPPR